MKLHDMDASLFFHTRSINSVLKVSADVFDMDWFFHAAVAVLYKILLVANAPQHRVAHFSFIIRRSLHYERYWLAIWVKL